MNNKNNNTKNFDLSLLFGSLSRVKLLALFLSNYEKSYYVRELTRLLNLQINSIRRELDNLEKLNIIKIDDKVENTKEMEDLLEGKPIKRCRSKTDKKYYKVNPNFLFIDELRSIFLKSKIFVRNSLFNNLVKEFDNLTYAVLLGKFVNDKDSNLDLLLVGDLATRKLDKFIKELEKSIGEEINYAVLSNEEFEYRKQIVDKFLYKILENNKIVLIDKRVDKLFNGNKNELIS